MLKPREPGPSKGFPEEVDLQGLPEVMAFLQIRFHNEVEDF
jgi:hypothetical protein